MSVNKLCNLVNIFNILLYELLWNLKYLFFSKILSQLKIFKIASQRGGQTMIKELAIL